MLGSNGTCAITVAFNPLTAGAKTDTLTIPTDHGNVDVVLYGTGVAVNALGQLSIARPANFGTRRIGDPARTQPVTIRNTGTAALGTIAASSSTSDFQVAIGNDADSSGSITDSASSTDEWLGNSSSDATMAAPSAGAAWLVGTKQPKQVRLSLLLQTLNSYSGSPPTLTPFEDRTSGYPTIGSYNPRFRSAQIVVAPRAWNLAE